MIQHCLLFVYKDPNSPPLLGVWFGGWGGNVIRNHRAPKRQGIDSLTGCQLPGVGGAPSFTLALGSIICKSDADISGKNTQKAFSGC